MVRFAWTAFTPRLTFHYRIIVGVKYCFRYNQRNRQMRTGEDGEPIDMNAMPARRRRREKKLMTIDEVNERFPIQKYKTWRATREQEGLPTAGGINPDALPAGTRSRPASIRNEEGAIARKEGHTEPSTTANITQVQTLETPNAETIPAHGEPEAIESAPAPRKSTDQSKPATTDASAAARPRTESEAVAEEEDEDQIQQSMPAEVLAAPGDTCAICIDNLEDDEDVRGLTCGHAFHASCLDPWLTSRRACCPMCKADYYVPKPRPEGQEASENPSGRRGRGPNMPAAPQYAFMGGRGGMHMNPFNRHGTGNRRPSLILPGRFMTIVYNENDRYGFPQVVREPRPPGSSRRTRSVSNTADGMETHIGEDRTPAVNSRHPSMFQRIVNRFPQPLSEQERNRVTGGRQSVWTRLTSRNQNTSSAQQPTPAELEAAQTRS